MPALVLASTSIYRRELLTRLGVPFSAVAPTCDEEALKDPALLPAELAAHLAREKARSLAPHHPDAHVLGSDQLVEIDGQVLGKPGTRDNAIAQLSQLSGRTHRLITAFALVSPDGALSQHLDVHTLRWATRASSPVARAASIAGDDRALHLAQCSVARVSPSSACT